MQTKYSLDSGWHFLKQDDPAAISQIMGAPITLPHTWNAQDGQDGGNDYHRGRCWYTNCFQVPLLEKDEQLWLEVEGAAMTAQVYLNGQFLTLHQGGYSTFRVELTSALVPGDNLLSISVDNSINDRVYPQKADFTFYGGLYRGVSLIRVPAVHFALDYHGSCGIKITPQVDLSRQRASVSVAAWVENGEGHQVTFHLEGHSLTVPVYQGTAQAEFVLEPVHLWNGVEDPYLYTLTAKLDSGDERAVPFGCRTIAFDPEQGFLLNGHIYRLCGAARHQDRQGLGSALTAREEEEDMALLLEIGANTVRLAHYQHSQHFYDLCDRYGLVVWAEIPYITQHLENGVENTLSQMTELIVQNYNHPSIICWGLSNEITAAGGVTPEIEENHRQLNDLCHRLDPTRPTTMAHAFMLDMDDPFVSLSDIRSYNLYYGWYLGELEQNDQWFDEFHRKHPQLVIGLSEYGADANPAYQSESPERGDWTEGYQALYHEHMLRLWSERPYIWAMHCWNMFDFGADGRDEGGKPGQNQKGLVTFDRETKKDAFYLYKAYLSREPFVHLCGRRYQDRPSEMTQVKVYSNQSKVTLLVDGKVFEVQTGDKVFLFQVPLSGTHTIQARSGQLWDEMTIRKVEKPNPEYTVQGGQVVNWFDRPDEVVRDGYYSILDSMEEIKKSAVGAALLAKMMERVSASYGDVAKSVTLPPAVQRQMDKMPLEKLLKQAGNAVSPAMVKELNAALNRIARK